MAHDWAKELDLELEVHLAKQKQAEEAEILAIEEQNESTSAYYNSDEVIEAMKNDLNMLGAVCMSDIFRYDYPPVLLAAWNFLLEFVKQVKIFPQLALGIPRGHAKTTMIKLFIIYCILFTKKKFILIIASTGPLAENILADVIDMLEEPNIKKLFGYWKEGQDRFDVIDRQNLRKFGFRGRVIILAAIGAEGSIRGLNIKNERPDVMIFEDVQTRECADSKTQSETLERWMIGTAMKAKSPAGCMFIFVGNMYPTDYSILKKLKKNPTWIKLISGAILADGTALWEELRSLKSLIEELDNDMQMGHPEIFFAEVLNDTEIGINTRVDYSLFKEWKWTKEDTPQGKCIIIDPSAGKVGRDNVAIGYFEIYDELPGMRELIQENLSPGNTIRTALLMALRTGTRVIAVESNAYQSTLLYWFDQIAQSLDLKGFHFVEIYSTGYSKNSRIIDTIKAMTAGEIVLHDSVKGLVQSQIANWNPLKRNNVDDALDLLGYVRKVMEQYGAILATDYEIIMQDYMVIPGETDNSPSLF